MNDFLNNNLKISEIESENMNNLISKHFTDADNVKINYMECSLWYDKEEDLPCNYIEEGNECNICFEHKKKNFSNVINVIIYHVLHALTNIILV